LVEGVFCKGIHRAPIFETGLDGREKLVGLVSQSDIIRYLARHPSDWEKTGSLTLEDLKLGTTSPITMSHKSLAVHGFFSMYHHKVSAVAVTMDGKLLANLSASDLRGLVYSGMETLLYAVPAFLWCNRPVARHPMTCKPKTRLATVITRLGLFNLHRLWITDESEAPQGIVSLTDLMKTIATW